MKKSLSVFLLLIGTIVNVFAIKLPTGDSVRALDVKEDGDAIVEVKLGGEEPVEITTPIGKLKVKAGSTLSFYKSGALKSATFSKTNDPIETPIGKLSLSNELDRISVSFFYESGCPQKLYVTNKPVISIGEYNYTLCDSDYEYIYFFDSGSKDKWIVKELYSSSLQYYVKDEYLTKYSNKSGNFYLFASNLTFYENGNVKKGFLAKSPETPVIIDDNEVFIKGPKEKYDRNLWIEFYNDGTIKTFTSDELCMTNQGGVKLNIPAGSRIVLHKNGKIQKCTTSNNNIITVKSKSYELNKSTYLFNQDGSLKGFYAGFASEDKNYSGYADAFYDDGSVKRLINSNEEQDFSNSNYFRKFVYAFFNQKGQVFYAHDVYNVNYVKNNYSYYYFQPEDYVENVAMIYFDDNGIPSSYTLFKLNKDGDYLLDEMGYPIEDTTKKTFVKK